MNRAEHERVRELIGLWMSCQDKLAAIKEIALAGPTQEQKMMEFHGDFPQLSNIKPEILISKVDKMSRFYISRDEMRANVMLCAYPDKLRRILTAYEQKKNKHNSFTGKPFTHGDIAYILKLRVERYHKIKDYLGELLLEVDSGASTVDGLKIALKSIA